MKVVLLRVGVDSGSGGIQGPLFQDGSFELVPIPDNSGVGLRTYGNTKGIKERNFSEYFPANRRRNICDQTMHVDPEFETYTYGDPTSPKAGLRNLEPGDLLVFYAGLSGWDHARAPALYIIGYFIVELAGRAIDLSDADISGKCGQNFHVMHESLYRKQRDRLVLVKGGEGSRMLKNAYCISALSQDRAGQTLKVLSPEAQEVFSDFGGRVSIQRSPPRWVPESHVERAKNFVLALP
jgi:hypothetical protein